MLARMWNHRLQRCPTRRHSWDSQKLAARSIVSIIVGRAVAIKTWILKLYLISLSHHSNSLKQPNSSYNFSAALTENKTALTLKYRTEMITLHYQILIMEGAPDLSFCVGEYLCIYLFIYLEFILMLSYFWMVSSVNYLLT